MSDPPGMTLASSLARGKVLKNHHYSLLLGAREISDIVPCFVAPPMTPSMPMSNVLRAIHDMNGPMDSVALGRGEQKRDDRSAAFRRIVLHQRRRRMQMAWYQCVESGEGLGSCDCRVLFCA